MRLRLVRPSLKYFASFLKSVTGPADELLPPLAYLAKAKAQQTELEYWLVDDERCFGRIRIRSEAKGRRTAIATHIDFELKNSPVYTSQELRVIRLAVRKAKSLGIDPVLVACEATDRTRRRDVEKSGGHLLRVVRERVPGHHGKLRVYSFSAFASQAVSREPGHFGKNIPGAPVSEPLARAAV